MKHISESIIGRKGTIFLPKDNIQIGDILVKRNGYYWYLQDDMMIIHPNKDAEDWVVYIDDFLSSYDNMLRDIEGEKSHDIVSIYRSGNSIRNPNYKKIENFINHNLPIWKSPDFKNRKHIYESIIGRKGTIFSPKDNIQIGDILVQRNGYYWYLQDDMMLASMLIDCSREMNVYIEDFLISYDDKLRDIRGDEHKNCDIVCIYRSGNSIRNPDYKKIQNFINHNSPIWKF